MKTIKTILLGILIVCLALPIFGVGLNSTAYMAVAKADWFGFSEPNSGVETYGTQNENETAAATVYTVQRGDSLWKIAVKFEVGLKELISANPQIKNIALIYVGQKINIPNAAPLKSIEDEILRLINLERSRNGLQTLTSNWQAARVARIKSQDMINNNYFSHLSPVYGSPFKMMEDFGIRFSAAAENIAYGQRTAQEAVNSWMNSAGHRANILSRSYTQTGIGVAKKANGTLYFTQVFLKPI